MSEIKPCPFCGSENLEIRGRGLKIIHCNVCGGECGLEETLDKAIGKWNKRPYDYDMPAIVKKVQQLEKALVRCGRAINYACEYYLDFSAGAEVLAHINGYDDQEDLEPLLRQLEEKSCKQPE